MHLTAGSLVLIAFDLAWPCPRKVGTPSYFALRSISSSGVTVPLAGNPTLD